MVDLPKIPNVITPQGVAMPQMLYGTAWKRERTTMLVTAALAAGFRGIDTACQPKHYAQAAVGAALVDAVERGLSRASLYVQTKFTPLAGHDLVNVPYAAEARPAAQVRQSMETSLAQLQVDYVDALLLHSPLLNETEMAEVWQTMETLCDAGDTRLIGISNCTDLHWFAALFARARIKPAVLQNRFHARTGYDVALRAFCRQHGVVYQSFWTLTANPQLLGHARLRALAARYRRSPAQILFRYLTQMEIVPLTGTQSRLHLREDLEIFDFALTPADIAGLSPLLR